MASSYVTDTHPLVFHLTRSRSLSPRAASIFEACEARRAIVYVPTVVLWELCLLIRVGKVHIEKPVRMLCQALFGNPAYQPLTLDVETVTMAYEERPNDDPFDGLIAASARALDLPLITRDGALRDWGRIRTVW